MHLNSGLKTIVFVLLVIIALPMIPVRGISSTGPTTYEQYGPRLDTIHMRFLGTPENTFAELDSGGIDIVDWGLTSLYKNKWEDPNDPQYNNVQVVGYGGEYGYFILDVRENRTKPVVSGWSTQSYVMTGDPTIVGPITLSTGETYTTTRAAFARRALAHMVNRTYVVSDVLQGLADPLFTVVPIAQGDYVYPTPTIFATNPVLAAEILTKAGITDNDGDGWRDIPGTNEELILDFYIRLGAGRYEFGTDLANRIESDLKIKVHAVVGGRPTASDHVMANKEMDLYTGGWIFDFTPDNKPWTYASIGYWHPGNPPNYMAYSGPYPYAGAVEAYGQIFDPNIETQATLILESIDRDVVKAAAWEMQRLMQIKENVYTIPVWSAAAPKAYRTNKIGTSEAWQGIVNQKGIGVNTWWTFFSANTAANPNSGVINYGFSTETLGMLNIIYAQWYWDSEVMGKIYDSMLMTDPYTAEEIPWVASSWISQLEYDPAQGAAVSTLTFNLRHDVYWQDGWQLTADDIIFTLVELWNIKNTGLLQTGGFPDPWWVSSLSNIDHIDKIDNFTIKVWMNVATFFALRWVGLNVIMPKHVWQPIAASGDPTTFAPDTKVIGSGPYRIFPNDYTAIYTPYSSIDLYAYKPGSVTVGEYIYRDVANPGTVGTGDVRLTAVGAYAAGSTVATDTDVGTPLVAFGGNETHTENVLANWHWDSGEYIYSDEDASANVTAGDIRLTAVGGYAAGTTVGAGDSDATPPSAALVAFAVGANEMHREVTVNGKFDPGEDMYKDNDVSGTVTGGDKRLTAVGGYAAGSTVADTDAGTALIAFAANEKHTEVTVNGQFDTGEYIYRDVTTLGTVSTGDVRLTQVGSYLGGSVVEPADSDVGQTLIAFASNEKHRESLAANSAYDGVNPHGFFQETYVQAVDDPKTLVGSGFESDQRVFVKIMNYKLTSLTGVTVTLHVNGTLFGSPLSVNVPAATNNGQTPGVTRIVFLYNTPFTSDTTFRVTASHGTSTDVEIETFKMKVTVAGDVDSTGNTVGNVVNVIDANRLVANWGLTGPWSYANADILDTPSQSANTVDIFDAGKLSLNYAQ